MLPHKFGAVFAQIPGKQVPGLQYDLRGKAEVRTPLYFAQFGRHKVQIWLFGGWKGDSVQEIVASGKGQIEAIAGQLAQKYGITLTLLRFYDDIEWVDVSKERSAKTAKGAGIRKGEGVEVAGALHKYDKSSHDGHIEFNKLPNGEDNKPTEHAEIREYIYSGQLAHDLHAIKEVVLEERKLLSEVVGGFVGVRQRLEIVEKSK
jgi:hypothetical protein